MNTVGVPQPRERGIRIVGVGDAGGRAVDWIAAQGLALVETLAINTYASALEVSRAGTRIQVGEGQGVGGDPTQGRLAAEACARDFHEALKGSSQVYLVAGLGGGTGSGVTPVVAHAAWQAGASVMAVVARPFAFEGQQRASAAASAIAMLEQRTHRLAGGHRGRPAALPARLRSAGPPARLRAAGPRPGLAGARPPGGVRLRWRTV